MRDTTIAAAVVVALLGIGCGGKTDSSSAASQPSARATEQAPLDLRPAAKPVESPKRHKKHKKATRVARAPKPAKAARSTERKAQVASTEQPSAPTLNLKQARPSSY